jgi:hypothetical protein
MSNTEAFQSAIETAVATGEQFDHFIERTQEMYERIERERRIQEREAYDMRIAEGVTQFTRELLEIQPNQSEIVTVTRTVRTDIVNGILFGPTQLGKTQATINIIRECTRQQIPIVMSVDNKNDQHEQIYRRIVKYLENAGVYVFKFRKNNKKFQTKLEQLIGSRMNFVIVLMDNASQIREMGNAIMQIHNRNNLRRLVVLHDEVLLFIHSSLKV